ncbi:MAG: nucleotidyl transferase AbiEii/AbiGii toxin family protein [Ruminococcaceae bacterium]|nr:nucleotidyl transferase AbiEii/AbiGii toxin family protein [Oscillospiraceae bacterium]
MSKFYVESKEELQILITNAAGKLGTSEAVVEKDYWVSFILDYLFNQNRWKDAFTFKGGTSLSKCYGLIERFSEDIDLILDWRVLGYSKDEPWASRSNTQQDKFNKEVNLKTENFLKDVFIKELEKDFKKLYKVEIRFFLDAEDSKSIRVEYPIAFSSAYLTQTIKMEIGSFAAWTPAIETEIEPIISKMYPKLFKGKSCIRTVSPERTFWEKATILHHEANRPKALYMPVRHARHYYDLYEMSNTYVKDLAFSNRELLKKVTKFKMKFYPRGWARYEDVLDGKLRLVPDNFRFAEIEKDYDAMKEMIYGETPSFDEIMKSLTNLENEINM